MLVYLDANIVQYLADDSDIIFRCKAPARVPPVKLKAELLALGDVIELAIRTEQQDLDRRWDIAAPQHLLGELLRGRPTFEQRETYQLLREAWHELGVERHPAPDVDAVIAADKRLLSLKLSDPPDRRHLAEAVAIGAAWFLTLDRDILDKTRQKEEPSEPGRIGSAMVARPSELRARMRFDPVLGLTLAPRGAGEPDR